ncbi:MAG: LemA family protein [Paludibacteraceae bacterium]|nr:LemA family protein [Paludibacteraceae bacterium]
MKKSSLIFIILLAVVALVALWGVKSYNGFVVQEENVETAWGNVQTQYQRRADLIPNLVATVKGYAAHESETLEAVMAARAKATTINVDASNMTPEQLQAYPASQGALSTALGRLIAVAESYPDLKANQNFLDLQSQLEGTENRIAVARKTFNETAQQYNTQIRQFPANIVAGICGFDKKPYFEADAAAQAAPTVQF